MSLVRPALACTLLILAAPRALAAQQSHPGLGDRLSEEEKERLRLARPAEVAAPAGRDSLPWASIRPGMRVMINARGHWAPRRGFVAGLASDTLLFDGLLNRELVRIPFDHLSGVSVSTGLARGTTTSRLVGVGVGTVAGYLLGSVRRINDREVFDRTALTGAAAGAVAGFVVGSWRRDHRWRPVALPASRGGTSPR